MYPQLWPACCYNGKTGTLCTQEVSCMDVDKIIRYGTPKWDVTAISVVKKMSLQKEGKNTLSLLT